MKNEMSFYFANLQNNNPKKIFSPLKQKFLAVLLGVSGVFFAPNLSAQGETCGDPIEISASDTYSETSLLFENGQDKLYLSFYSTAPSLLINIISSGTMPDSLHLMNDSCGSLPIVSQSVLVDSNSVQSLSLSIYNMESDKTYLIMIERNSSIGTLDFDIGAANYSPTPGCSPSPCPVACNKLYNGSFEEELAVPTPTNWNQNIHFSKGWIRPNSQGNSADYYHRNSLDPGSEVPTSFFGTHYAVDGLEGNDAYAGLFTIFNSSSNFREWMSGTLREPLIQGHKYKVVMYANLVAHSTYDSPSLPPGLKFSTSPFTNESSSSIIAMTADIQSNEVVTNPSDWVKISGEYIAQGGEQYVNIANFKSNVESVGSYPLNNSVSYFFVDAVSVTDMGACCDNELVIEDGWDVDDVLSASEFAPFISGNVLSTNAQVKVNGTFNINQSFVMDNTHFVMAANAEITLSSGVDLTINESILEVCGNTMWNGITVDDVTSEVIISGSEIWEAKKGINSLNGGVFTVSNTLFDGNNYGIYVDEYNGVHSGTIKSSIFKSSDFLLAPFAGGRPDAGIYLNEVANLTGDKGIKIGSTASSDDGNFFYGPGLNTFSGTMAPGLMYGIKMYFSSSEIFNNTFVSFISEDILDPSNKAGIHVRGHDKLVFGKSPSTVTIGGHNSNESNAFFNSTKGIVVDSVAHLNIKKNEFSMFLNKYSTGIKMRNNIDYTEIIIVDNIIVNPRTGIDGSILTEKAKIIIDRNNITLPTNSFAKGIYINKAQIQGASGDYFSISNNLITNGTRGIEINDITSIDKINDNTFSNLNNTIYTENFVALPNYGIRVTNSFNIGSIESNDIISSSTTDTRVYGMSIEMTGAANNITCNTIENTGTAMHFGGVVVPSWQVEKVYGNEMKGNHNGLVLTNSSELGDVGSSSKPSDNKWTGTYTGYHTYTDGAVGSQTTLWTRSGGLPYVPQSNGSNSPPSTPLIINSSATGTNYDCGGIIIGPGGSFASSVNNNSFEVPNFESGNLSDTLAWLANYQFYRSLPEDSLITDVNMQEYKDSMDQTALGQMLQLQEQMNDSSFSIQNSMNILNGLDSLNHMEENMKEVLKILLDIREEEWDTLPNWEMDVMENLSISCPFIEGPAVYTSRGILNSFNGKNYSNECELYEDTSTTLLRRKESGMESKKGVDIEVYPNPSRESVNVSIILEEWETANIQIFDLSGREVMRSQLNNGINSINTFKLKATVYYYNIIVNNGSSLAGR